MVNGAKQQSLSSGIPSSETCNFFRQETDFVPLVANSVLVIGTLLSFMTLLNNVSLGYMQSFKTEHLCVLTRM